MYIYKAYTYIYKAYTYVLLLEVVTLTNNGAIRKLCVKDLRYCQLMNNNA